MLNYEFKKIKDTYILRLNKGAEIIQSIKDFSCKKPPYPIVIFSCGSLAPVAFLPESAA